MCKTCMQSMYQVYWNKMWNRQIAGALLPSSVWNNLRVNSNSVSEALLTVLKVLLAWEEWEKKRRMSKSMHVSSSTIHCAIIMPFKKKRRKKDCVKEKTFNTIVNVGWKETCCAANKNILMLLNYPLRKQSGLDNLLRFSSRCRLWCRYILQNMSL